MRNDAGVNTGGEGSMAYGVNAGGKGSMANGEEGVVLLFIFCS